MCEAMMYSVSLNNSISNLNNSSGDKHF